MLFAIYIQKLHNCIEPTTPRGEFTNKILKMIVKNEELLEYSDSSYNRFFDGKIQGKGSDKKIVGDMIYTCARTISVTLDISEGNNEVFPKYKSYLTNFQFNIPAINKLCDEFRCECPTIDINNYANELAKLLLNIMNTAAERPVNCTDDNAEGENILPSTTNDNHTEGNNVTTVVINISSKNEVQLENLKEQINTLYTSFLELNDKGSQLYLTHEYLSEDVVTEKGREFDDLLIKFNKEHEKLRQYYLFFPELVVIFEKMTELASKTAFWYRIENGVVECDPNIGEYSECIKEVWEALTK